MIGHMNRERNGINRWFGVEKHKNSDINRGTGEEHNRFRCD
jgi:hypothetical protein